MYFEGFPTQLEIHFKDEDGILSTIKKKSWSFYFYFYYFSLPSLSILFIYSFFLSYGFLDIHLSF